MGVLRDLVTRFSFDVNKKDVNKYDKTVKGMTRQALKLGAIFGGAFTVKGLIGSGIAAERAAFNLERLAETDFSKLQNMLKQTRAELNSIKKGSGNTFTDKNFNLGAAKFVEDFGHGNDALKLFNAILSSTSKIVTRTGGNINEMMGIFQEATKSGNFDFLKQFPEFDQVYVNKRNRLNNIFDPGEFGGEIGLTQKTNIVMSLLKQIEASQIKSLKNLPDSILAANRAAKNFQNTLDKSGKSFNKVLVPITNFFANEFKDIGEFIEDIDKHGPSELLQIALPKSAIESLRNAGVLKGGAKNIVSDAPRPSASGRINRSGGTINNTFNITTDDPRKAASIAVQKMNEEIRKARNQLVHTEER